MYTATLGGGGEVWGNLKQRCCLEEAEVYGRLILKLILNKFDSMAQNRDKWQARLNIHEISFVKFLDQVRRYWLLEKGQV